MRNLKYFIMLKLATFLFCSHVPDALGIEKPADFNSLDEIIPAPKVVDANLAAFAAADYLPAFYPGNWEFFNHLVCYDLEGFPAAYMIIFRDPNSPIKTWEEVTTQVKKASDELDETDRQIKILQASQKTPQEDKEKMIEERKAIKTRNVRKSYRTSDFATVVTGATEESQLLIRCYRGLPSVLVSKPKLKKELDKKYKDKELQLGPIIYFGPSDFKYELKAKKPKKLKEQVADEDMDALPEEESYIFSAKEKELVRLSEKKQQLEDFKAQKKKRLENLSPENRKLLEEGEVKGKLNNIEKWAEYEQIYLKELEKQQDGEGSK